MQHEQKKKRISTRTVCTVGLLVAFSVAIGWICKNYLTFGAIRVTFENLPIILSGLLYGPLVGGIVGITADAISCITSTNPALNPIISAGAILIGVIPGVISRLFIKKHRTLQVWVSVFLSHITASMIIKSIGLHVFWGYGLEVLIWRVPLYIVIALCESIVISAMLKNKYISEKLSKQI